MIYIGQVDHQHDNIALIIIILFPSFICSPNELNDSVGFVNPAKFVSDATCFRDVEKQNAYYLFLVSQYFEHYIWYFSIIYLINFGFLSLSLLYFSAHGRSSTWHAPSISN